MLNYSAGRYSSVILGILRIVAGILFMQHGGQKLLGWFGGMGGNTAVFPSLPWFAGVLELFGGACIVLGLFTRPVAFLLSGEMAVAYFKAHAPNGFWPAANHGELAVLFCFVFLYLAAAGGGRFAVENLWKRRAIAT